MLSYIKRILKAVFTVFLPMYGIPILVLFGGLMLFDFYQNPVKWLLVIILIMIINLLSSLF